jgi:hypothetical protein
MKVSEGWFDIGVYSDERMRTAVSSTSKRGRTTGAIDNSGSGYVSAKRVHSDKAEGDMRP